MNHMCSLKPFQSSGAMSTITESTAEGSEDGESEAAFEEAQQRIWNNAMRRRVPAVKLKANSSSKATPGNGLGRARKIARAPRKSGDSSA